MSRTLTIVALKLALVAAVANAQNVTQPRATSPAQGNAKAEEYAPPAQTGAAYGNQRVAVQPGQPGQHQGNELNDAIATGLLLGNQEEIALAQFAESKLQNPQAKQFAQTMIRDHQQAVQKLRQIAPNLASISLQGQNGGQQATPTATGNNPTHNQMVALHQRMAEKCLQLTEKELSQKNGAEFDMAYMGSQCMAHTQMLAKLQASQEFASGPLRQFVTDATSTVEHHLSMAKEIKESLKSNAGNATAQNSGQAGAPRR